MSPVLNVITPNLFQFLSIFTKKIFIRLKDRVHTTDATNKVKSRDPGPPSDDKISLHFSRLDCNKYQKGHDE